MHPTTLTTCSTASGWWCPRCSPQSLRVAKAPSSSCLLSQAQPFHQSSCRRARAAHACVPFGRMQVPRGFVTQSKGTNRPTWQHNMVSDANGLYPCVLHVAGRLQCHCWLHKRFPLPRQAGGTSQARPGLAAEVGHTPRPPCSSAPPPPPTPGAHAHEKAGRARSSGRPATTAAAAQHVE